MDQIIIILLSILQMGQTFDLLTPKIEVTPVMNENGYIIMKNEEKPMIEKYSKILHIFNTTEIEESVEDIKIAINMLEKEKHSNILDMIISEYNTLVQTLKTITPYKRQKRGLLNLGGKINKFIWGSMDNDDAEEIYAHLRNLDDNSKNIIVATNEQVTINNKLFKAVTDMKEHLNNQTKAIEKFLNDVSMTTNRLAKQEDRMEKLLELYLVVHRTNTAVEKFSDVILMSRLNLLAHDIFLDTEIEKYNINIENLPYIKTNVIFDKNQLIFVLKVPKLINKDYYEAIVIPFPNLNNLELDFPMIQRA